VKLFLSIILFVAVFASGCSTEENSWPRTEFNATQWKASRDTERYVFAHDIIQKRLLEGKTREQVQEILGAPTTVDTSSRQLSYLIKEGGSSFNQVFTLDVILNSSSQTVEEVGIRGD
jgi:outer membrane protein assembly factor BamE (lipoprotein component of BamABCDE complex)